MSVVSRPPSGKFTVARMVCILFVFCAATVIASPAQTVTILASFAGANGANPQSSLVRATDGNFYGTTYAGGSGNSRMLGTVFKITPAGTLTTLHSFQGPFSDGSTPFASLVQGTDGNFYGTTASGGSIGIGTVFKMTPSGTLTILHSFSGADGALPESELVQASDGNFYGTTSQVGLNGVGTVFKITPAGTLTTLNSFAQGGRIQSLRRTGASHRRELLRDDLRRRDQQQLHWWLRHCLQNDPKWHPDHTAQLQRHGRRPSAGLDGASQQRELLRDYVRWRGQR